MKFSGWSSLLIGALLTTTAVGLVRAEDAGVPVMVPSAHRQDVAARADVDETGSIAPAVAPREPVLSPLSPAEGRALTPLDPRSAARPDTATPNAVAVIDSAASTLPVPGAPDPTAPIAHAAAPTSSGESVPAAPTTTAQVDHVDAVAAIDAVAADLPVPAAIGTDGLPFAPGTPAAPPAPAVAMSEPAAAATTSTANAASEPPAAPAAAPAPTMAPSPEAVAASLAEAQVAEAMEKAAPSLVGRGGAPHERAERAAIVDFYRERGWKPFLVGPKDLTAEGRTLARAFAESDREGLDPTDYALPKRGEATAETRAQAEYALAETALRFVRHLASGRFDPERLSDLVTPHPPRPDPAAVLAGWSRGPDPSAALAAWAPPHEGYRRLRAELAKLRAETETPVVRVPDGPLLAPGQKDGRVALLRERMGVVASDADPETYDPALAEAVKAFQRERGLSPSGKVGRSTVAALNEESRGTTDRIADVVVNMERWRWLPRDLGELHVFVNIPDFHLDVMKDGRSIHHARVITGRPENPTPVFSETMEYVVVNPYWNVPYSIVKKEMMSRLQSGRIGGSFEVEVGNRRVDPGSVDWSTVSPAQVSIRQRPGDGNALGNIKFMFPNQHSVYIHDTSSRSLFARDYRALSHGCVRVHEPFSFADAVLSEEPSRLDGARLKKLLGRSEQQINLQRHVPVHITYFTEFVDDAGQLQSRRDVYGHDAKMRRILGL